MKLSRAVVLAVALCAGGLFAPAPALAGAPAYEWLLQTLPEQPQARAAAEMAYDGATEDIVLTGGEGFEGTATWLYDGSTWAEQSTAHHPPQFVASGVAYDAADEQVVIADGIVHAGIVSATWTYDGSDWTERHPTESTPATGEPAMAYDPATEDVVLFGGVHETGFSNETWLWNGSTWSEQSTPQSPPALLAASMAYDPGSEQLILFGGVSASHEDSNQTWAYDGTTWTELSTGQSPPAGLEGSLQYDPAIGELVYFGGPGNGGSETWTFNGEWTHRTTPEALTPRYGTSMAWDAATERLVLFAGWVQGEEEIGHLGGPSNETWLYAPKVATGLFQSPSAGVVLGGAVHDEATLSAGASPTGKIDFALYGVADTACSSAPVFTSEVEVSGAGTYESAAFEPPEAGTYRWVARYSGDAGNEPSATACGEAGGSVTVTKPEPRTEPKAETTVKGSPSPGSGSPASGSPGAHLRIYTRAPKGLINSRSLDVVVGCGASCTIGAQARVLLRGLGRTILLHGTGRVAAGRVGTVAFAVPRPVRALLRGYLRRHRGEHMKLDVTVTMTAPGTAQQTASAMLRVWTLPGLR